MAAADGGFDVRVPDRFRGPPGAANGGIVTALPVCVALQSAAADGRSVVASSVAARLRRSVPVEQPLRASAALSDTSCDVTLTGGTDELLTATVQLRDASSPLPDTSLGEIPGDLREAVDQLSRVQVPDRPPFFEETGDHPIPRCFSCGPAHPGGLSIYPRFAADGVVCAPWTPAREFDDGNGGIAPLVMTSAMDCSSGICMPVEQQRELLALDQFFLLGSLEVHYLRMPPIARPGGYRVAACALSREGRKHFGLSGLFGADGTPYAVARSVWIIAGITRSAAFGEPAQRSE